MLIIHKNCIWNNNCNYIGDSPICLAPWQYHNIRYTQKIFSIRPKYYNVEATFTESESTRERFPYDADFLNQEQLQKQLSYNGVIINAKAVALLY